MYRQIRENLHDLDATIHACLVIGYEDIGAQLLAEEAVSRVFWYGQRGPAQLPI